jgi:hypothetical protein
MQVRLEDVIDGKSRVLVKLLGDCGTFRRTQLGTSRQSPRIVSYGELFHLGEEGIQVRMLTRQLVMVPGGCGIGRQHCLPVLIEHAPAAVEHGFRHPRLRQLRAAHVAYDDVLIRLYDLATELVAGILPAAPDLAM